MGIYNKYHAEKRYNDDAPWIFATTTTYEDGQYFSQSETGYSSYSLNGITNRYTLSNKLPSITMPWYGTSYVDFDNNGTRIDRIQVSGLWSMNYYKYVSDNSSYYVRGTIITSFNGNRGDYPTGIRHTDGYWYEFSNYPPTTPSTITLPSSIPGNTNFNISWSKSSDGDFDSITYRLERSVNNGFFQLIYNGATTNYTDTAQSSWNTVQYRVRAYDGSDYSGIKTSDVSNVIHNQPPTTPSNINVPNEIVKNTSITVTWGASTDPEGDTITYYLQRKTGWSYVNIYNGTSRTYTENVSSSWNTIQYRVRAYDGTDYSNYITSNVVTVVENLPPTVPSFITVPTNIGVEETFNISWGESIDPEDDTITYYLERSINSGSYVSIYSGVNKNHFDTSQAGWNTVRYRVRAYDGIAYSDYKTSTIVTVIIKLFPELTMKIDNQLKTSEAGWVKIDNQLRDIEKIWIKVDGQLHEI